MADREIFLNEPSLSIPAFCLLEQIAKSTYFKMRRKGLAPKEMRVPGTSIVRITPEARRKWHERLEKLSKNEQVQETKKKLAARASKAGKLGAESPDHPCRRPPKPKKAGAQ